jgi:hypothetical protein
MDWICAACGRPQTKRKVEDGLICLACQESGVVDAPSLFPVEHAPPQPERDAQAQVDIEAAIAALRSEATSPDMAYLRARHAAQWPALWRAIDTIAAPAAQHEGDHHG